ncbi:MAG TPA: hypothetical protein VNL35_09535 [Chloroflexota bacterium]|nr:hypothetical protein [Chloroflexota bacterium]
MGTGSTVFGWVGVHVARMLATRPASPVILVGSLAIAGLGATAMHSTTVQGNPSPVVGTPALILNSPHTFCYSDPDGDGHTVCHILASQVSTVPNLGCYDDPDGDGTSICYYATDPTASN